MQPVEHFGAEKKMPHRSQKRSKPDRVSWFMDSTLLFFDALIPYKNKLIYKKEHVFRSIMYPNSTWQLHSKGRDYETTNLFYCRIISTCRSRNFLGFPRHHLVELVKEIIWLAKRQAKTFASQNNWLGIGCRSCLIKLFYFKGLICLSANITL